MKFYCFISFSLFLTSCGQTFNSSSSDARYGVVTQSAAITILNNNCVNCHDGYHNAWGVYKTFDDYDNAGLVNSGDPDNSQIIIRLKNFGGDMPKNAGALSDADYLVLQNWITSGTN